MGRRTGSDNDIVAAMHALTDELVASIDRLAFSPPVTHVYNPLTYARKGYDQYLQRYGNSAKPVVLVGMNPGPFGMAQTGVPFGDVTMVKEWMGIHAIVDPPEHPHPKRPVTGFACSRKEVSGSRLWGWAAARYGGPDAFFGQFFVLNYCPLVFMEASGRNRTPDKLPVAERKRLFAICDRALAGAIHLFRPRWVVGIGGFAEKRVQAALKGMTVTTGRILHPSPASPLANRGWPERVESALAELGIKVRTGKRMGLR